MMLNICGYFSWLICALFCFTSGLKDLLSDACQLMKRLTQLLKKQKYGDAENGEPKS